MRDEISARACAAAVRVARDAGLAVTAPQILNDGVSLMVHLAPAPVVARVATRVSSLRPQIETWLAREIAVTSYLACSGVPVVTPSPELDAGPVRRDGFPMTFWTHLVPDPDRSPTTDECSAMLAELHAAMRGYPGDLPVLAPAVNDIPPGMAALDDLAPLVTPAEIDHLRGRADALRGFALAPDADLVPLHGDAHPGNLHPTRDGLVWIDFEDVCRGPAEWDLALLSWIDAWSGTTTVTRHHTPDPALMATCSELRALRIVGSLALLPGMFGRTTASGPPGVTTS